MNLPHFHPAAGATTLLTLAIALAGAIALQCASFPFAQVDSNLSVGAGLRERAPRSWHLQSPLRWSASWTHCGVTEMTSASSLGTTSITIQFDLSRNIDGAARDVEAAISAARTYLRKSARQSHYRKVNPPTRRS